MAVPPEAESLVALFEDLPHVMFSLKSLDGRYIAVNQAFADRASCRSPLDVVGRRAEDLFAPELALSYQAQDDVLVRTARSFRRQLELINRPDGGLGWYVTNKSLIKDAAGRPVAIAAVSVDERVPAPNEPMDGLAVALLHIRAHFQEPYSLPDLAAIAQLTPGALERRMRRVLGLSPRQLVLRTRVEEAVHLLVTTSMPLSAVAAACGFFDQAALNRQMRRLLGVTPGSVRKVAATRDRGTKPVARSGNAPEVGRVGSWRGDEP
jgi:AraC-like DNA-binding protein